MSSSGQINNLVNPSSSQDAATKSYVDTQVSTASTAATSAQTTANSAVTKADSAQTKANSAYDAATTAQSTANTAVTKADSAQTKADSAATAASTAQTTANSAASSASTISTSLTYGSATASAQYLFPSSGSNAGIATNEVWRITVTPAGRVGIGTQNPDYPLEIATSVSYTAPSSPNPFFFDGEGPVPRYGGAFTYNMSLRITNGARIGGVFIFDSDKRMKKNIKDVDGNTALLQIRKIRPKTYNYIDYNKGNGNIYGFIAQDVKDVILDSTTWSKDYIPNFFCQGSIHSLDTSNNIYEISSDNDLSFQMVIDNSVNEVTDYKIKIYDDKNNEYICSVIQINSQKNIVVKLGKEYKFSNDEEHKNKVFIYGQEVNDFLSIEKETIYTVATAALQEVDRQQQADKARIAELETTVATQQSLINDILERLKALEKV